MSDPAEAGRRSLFEGIATDTPVLVITALSAAPGAPRSFHTTLGIARSLGRLGVPVYAMDANPGGPSSASRYLRRRYIVDLPPDASLAQTTQHLVEAGRRLGSRAVLIPTWDDISVAVAEAYPALQEHFLIPDQPQGLARSLASKKGMYRLAVEHGVPTPRSSFPSSIEEVHAYAAEATFPVMIKGINGYRLAKRAGRTLFLVERPEELVRRYVEIEDPLEPNVMLQEYIPGGDDAVWMFNGYFDGRSECLFGMTGQKLRQWPPYAGTTTLGVCRPNGTVVEQTRRWMKAVGYRGMIDMGYRFDARDGQYKVLDVNPRIGSTFRLFVGRLGVDTVRAHYLDMTGQSVPVDEMVEGRKWLDERDLASSITYWRDGNLSLPQWAASLRGVQELVHAARDDLAPLARLPRLVADSGLRKSRRP
jgi:predicted ATP-grasp superfamily ATP-dependent carboligase